VNRFEKTVQFQLGTKEKKTRKPNSKTNPKPNLPPALETRSWKGRTARQLNFIIQR
jgi:hypothetical protein